MNQRYRVTERTQLNHGGRLYQGGDEVNLTNDEAAVLLAAGTVEKAGTKAVKKGGKAVQRAENK